MLATNKSGTILMRDNTPLPTGMAIERDVFLPGWKAVKDLDGYQLGQKIEGAKWNFFYLADSLQITNVVAKRFFGIPFVKLTAHSRHIQESIFLVPTKEVLWAIRPLAAPEIGSHRNTKPHQTEAVTRRHTALISSS
jgi:hypothetical protein